jgi:hypothetical protein
MSERETVVELPFAADCCPCVEKLRTVLPFTVAIRDGVVQLVSTLGSVVISAQTHEGCNPQPRVRLFFNSLRRGTLSRTLSVSDFQGGWGCVRP